MTNEEIQEAYGVIRAIGADDKEAVRDRIDEVTAALKISGIEPDVITMTALFSLAVAGTVNLIRKERAETKSPAQETP